MKLIKKNKKAHFNYFLLQHYEAGLVLKGPEVKAIKEGSIDITEGYIREKDNDFYLWNCPITTNKYLEGTEVPKDRLRKLLLHKREMDEIKRNINEKKLTVVPVSLGLDKGLIKIEIAIAKGKKQYDKRFTEKLRESEKIMRKYVLKKV